MILQRAGKVYNIGMQKKLTPVIILSVVILVFFYFKGILFLDPDFGWHLKMGEFILLHGIPATDPFSYTMPSYPFVDHEWLTNVLIAKVMVGWGYNFLGVVLAVLTLGALSLSLATIDKKNLRFVPIPFLLAGLTFYAFAGVRVQVITWFFFALLLWIVRTQDRFLRFRWLIPVLFVFWVNLHGGFAVGIVALLLACVYWYRQKKSSGWSLALLFLLSLAATCISPYGYRIWWEVWMQMTDGMLRVSIQEWLPAFYDLDLAMWVFTALSVILVVRNIKKFSFLDLALYFGLFAAALSSIRHMPLWFLIALPLTIRGIELFFVEAANIEKGAERFIKFGKVLFTVCCLLLIFPLWMTISGLGFIGKQSSYPDQAIAYLNTHPVKGQIFSAYDWGGYLIWKLPNKKVFIDGRMPSWRWEVNLTGESKYAFADYRKLAYEKFTFDQTVKKYKITVLLLPQQPASKNNFLDNLIIDWGNNILHLPLKKDAGLLNVVEAARKEGWKIVYQDETAVVYQKL